MENSKTWKGRESASLALFLSSMCVRKAQWEVSVTSHIRTTMSESLLPAHPTSRMCFLSLSLSVSRGQEQGPISLFVVKLKQFYTTWPHRSLSAQPQRHAGMQPSGSKELRSTSCRLGINAMETMTSSVVFCVWSSGAVLRGHLGEGHLRLALMLISALPCWPRMSHQPSYSS